MAFITKYIELLMSHPLTTPVVSLGLLALTLHLVLPLLCEIWRYYPNKITGKETIKNWYLERLPLRSFSVRRVSQKHGVYLNCCNILKDVSRSEAEQYVEVNSKKGLEEGRNGVTYRYAIEDQAVIKVIGTGITISIVSLLVGALTYIIEYLLTNFFIYTLVAGLAVGLHFTVVLLGRKLYSVSEDVKALKAAKTEEEKTNDD